MGSFFSGEGAAGLTGVVPGRAGTPGLAACTGVVGLTAGVDGLAAGVADLFPAGGVVGFATTTKYIESLTNLVFLIEQ